MKQLGLMIFLLTFATAGAHADAFAVKIGGQGWQTTADSGPLEAEENALSVWVALEHPIPLIPNAKIRSFDFEENDKLMVLKTTDYLLYYELLDNAALTLDLGVGIHEISSGEVAGYEFEETLPAIYGAARFPFFDSDQGLGLYAEVLAASEDNVSMTDLQLGLSYSFSLSIIDLHLLAGYRVMSYELDGINDRTFAEQDFDGFTLGFELDI
ncbi:TIGR04219 family outer membrane beta-barrel protein [uncultured Umboniibacter sp.]|uniref:TIGR04219 family outer membrane beta-barrel protein n=1 Tax=uncultured Umboniibacter sp. TaxID=1798917 RepID=UPI00262A68F8|nr:TIGR04219 family outer membrane beta-barrel protein [uncultured Umboniibacter sp.]